VYTCRNQDPRQQFTWSLPRRPWARRFFEHWRQSLKWQRLQPFEKFAALIEEHWHGIVTSCDEQNQVMLGFVEGFNNKIRAIQRRAFGIRDEEYLRLKVLSSMLPKIEE
jgi:transposase